VAEADGERRSRSGRLIAWIGAILGTLGIACALAWELGPRYLPLLVIDWSPSDAHALRAYALHRDGSLGGLAAERLGYRQVFDDDARLWRAALACGDSRQIVVRHLAAECLMHCDQLEDRADEGRGRALHALATCAQDAGFGQRGRAAWHLAHEMHPKAQEIAAGAFAADRGDVHAALALAVSGHWQSFPSVLQAWRDGLGRDDKEWAVLGTDFTIFSDRGWTMRDAVVAFTQPEATPDVIALLDDADEVVGALAVEMLLSRSDRLAMTAILQRARGEIPCAMLETRRQILAGASAAQIPPDELIGIASSADDPCAETAFSCLLGRQQLDAQTARLLETCAASAVRRGALIQLDLLAAYQDIDVVMAALDAADPLIVREAVNVLAAWPTAVVAEPLAHALAQGDGRLRAAAMRALGSRDGPLEDAVVSAGLADADVAVRVETLLAIGRQERAAYVPTLLIGLEDALADIRGASASALGRFGDDTATRPLLDLLDRESDPRVSAAVLIAIDRCGAAEHAARVEARREALVAAHGEALDSPWDDR